MKGKVASLLAAAFVVAACGGGEPSSPGDAFCKGYCQAAVRCGAVAGTCHDACVEQLGFSDLSVEGAGRLGDCTSGFDCGTLENEDAWNAAEQDCAAAAGAATPRTPEFRAFCAAYSEAWFDCNTVFSTTECEDDFVLYADDVIDSLKQCIDASTCAELEPCVKKVFGS